MISRRCKGPDFSQLMLLCINWTQKIAAMLQCTTAYHCMCTSQPAAFSPSFQVLLLYDQAAPVQKAALGCSKADAVAQVKRFPQHHHCQPIRISIAGYCCAKNYLLIFLMNIREIGRKMDRQEMRKPVLPWWGTRSKYTRSEEIVWLRTTMSWLCKSELPSKASSPLPRVWALPTASWRVRKRRKPRALEPAFKPVVFP